MFGRLVAFALIPLALALPAAEPADYQAVASAAQPSCSYALDEDAAGIAVSIRIDGLPAASGPPQIEVGIAAARIVRREVSAVSGPGGCTARVLIPWRDLSVDGTPAAEIRL
ncbi:MAG: hypothetical protein J0M02_09775, partial [Planctomycetes bacterium]|nr:hypothetical protein [Planctomycetota bacterium]